MSAEVIVVSLLTIGFVTVVNRLIRVEQRFERIQNKLDLVEQTEKINGEVIQLILEREQLQDERIKVITGIING